MIILASAPHADAGAVPQARRNLSLAERLALVEPDLERLLRDGPTQEVLHGIAARSGRSIRSARRMADEALLHLVSGAPEPEGRLPDDFYVAYAERNGNLAAAIRDFWPDPAVRPSKSSIYRWIDPGLQRALKKGRDALDHFMEIGVYAPLNRHDLLIIDETKIRIPARGPHGVRIETIHLLSGIEAAKKVVVNACVTVGPADELIASAFLARVWAGGEWDGVPYGGSYQAISLDNAFIFAKSDRFVRAMRAGGVPPRYARPYTPQDKAIKERWYRTLKDMALSAIPGNLRGPTVYEYVETGETREDGKPKKIRVPRPLNEIRDDEQILPLGELVQAIYAGIHDYNFNHIHSALGSSPLEAYAADQTPLRLVGLAALWPFALPLGRKSYRVERRGVWIDGAWWAVKRQAEVGSSVSIRHMPGLDPRYLIGTPDGRYLGEVTLAVLETETEREARLNNNREKARRLGEITKVTRQNALNRAAGRPGSAAHVSATSAKKLDAAHNDRPLADLSAALAVPARPEDAT